MCRTARREVTAATADIFSWPPGWPQRLGSGAVRQRTTDGSPASAAVCLQICSLRRRRRALAVADLPAPHGITVFRRANPAVARPGWHRRADDDSVCNGVYDLQESGATAIGRWKRSTVSPRGLKEALAQMRGRARFPAELRCKQFSRREARSISPTSASAVVRARRPSQNGPQVGTLERQPPDAGRP